MAKNENYEEYEEEIIERDEYVDVPVDEEIEEYDEDDYDDDYDDDEYDDDEYYDDEDEYDDEYYDENEDRFEQIFEELRQLRAQLSHNAQPYPYHQPYPYMGMGMPFMMPYMPYPQYYGPSPNEINMYNELGRIRDDLTRQNNAFVTHAEVARLQYDMSRDHQRNEDMLNMEIRRLNDRIAQKEREVHYQQQAYLPPPQQRERRERY